MFPASARPQRVAERESPRSREILFPRLLDERAWRFKRVFDVFCAILLGIAALPIFLLSALAIRLTSRGPVLFSHSRVGYRGRPFRVWKFRTMFQDAEAVLEQFLEENPEQAFEWERNRKLKNDPRVTWVGRLLRRTSLDELPQLWNILRGDMSMVGPRPIVREEARKYGQAFVLYSQVRPGLTGLWQVSGRNDTSYRRRIELDSEYIRNWTPRRDVRIVLRTFGAVLKGRGAY
jgi:Undecaprenyl-phosphate galactose phosphotransferase WbaP